MYMSFCPAHGAPSDLCLKLTPLFMNEQRKKMVQFHVESRDYFVSLATSLGLIEELIETELATLDHASREIRHLSHSLNKVASDLLFLQDHYIIELQSKQSSA